MGTKGIEITLTNFPISELLEKLGFCPSHRCKTPGKSWNYFLRTNFKIKVNCSGRFCLKVCSSRGVFMVNLTDKIRNTIDFRYKFAEVTLMTYDKGVLRTMTRNEVNKLKM